MVVLQQRGERNAEYSALCENTTSACLLSLLSSHVDTHTHTSSFTPPHAVPLQLDAQDVIECGELDQRDVADLLDVFRGQITHSSQTLSGLYYLKPLNTDHRNSDETQL